MILHPWDCTVICILYYEFAPSLAPHSASLRKWVTSCADGLFTRRHICSRPHLGFARYCQIVRTAHCQLQKVQNFQQCSKLSNPNWVMIMLLAAHWCSGVPCQSRGRTPLTFLKLCQSPVAKDEEKVKCLPFDVPMCLGKCKKNFEICCHFLSFSFVF